MCEQQKNLFSDLLGDYLSKNSHSGDYQLHPRVNLRTRPYANDQWSDALFESTVQRIQNSDKLFLLNNWWGDKHEDEEGNLIEIETLEAGRIHADHNFDDEDFRDKDGHRDPTLNRLFWGWSRPGFEHGYALGANAIPGYVRGKANGWYSRPLYRRAIEKIWIPFLDKFNYQKIYLCGSWGLDLIDLLRDKFGNSRQLIRRSHPSARLPHEWNEPREWDDE